MYEYLIVARAFLVKLQQPGVSDVFFSSMVGMCCSFVGIVSVKGISMHTRAFRPYTSKIGTVPYLLNFSIRCESQKDQTLR